MKPRRTCKRSTPMLPPSFVGIAASLALAASPAAAEVSAPPNQPWAASITERLHLTAAQTAALQNFLAVTAKAGEVSGLSEAQLRAMSYVERTDYFAKHLAEILASAKADAAALHVFYQSLSPEQRALFDRETSRHEQPNVAPDVAESAPRETPDYRLPSHVDANWLIKPTAENISRVYPSAAARNHVEGRVVLHCIIDTDGYLTECVVRSETPLDQGFGNAALEITGYMRMQPATNYGLPVQSEANIPITFALPDDR
jgi:TonB family protein